MTRASIGLRRPPSADRSTLRAILALAVAVSSIALAALQVGFAAVAGAIGVLVGVPGAFVELARAMLPIVVALLGAALAVRFGIRALRAKASVAGELARGGKLLATTAWTAWAWLVFELFYRQVWLGWASVFGSVSASLTWSAAAVALCFVADSLVPWSRAPRVLRQIGFFIVVAVALATALSAWSHRDVVPRISLIPVAIVGLGLMASGVRRVESGPRGRTLVELGLASTLLTAPIWRLFG